MTTIILVIVAAVVIPSVAVWVWRFQTRVVGALVPGADFDDVIALADMPVITSLENRPPLMTGAPVHLLAVTREAASLFIAYRPIASVAATVTTLLLDLATAGKREIIVLERWRSIATPVLVWADPVARSAVIQEPLTRLTVTLPFLA